MTPIAEPEKATQNRVIALFAKKLGYRYLGNWSDRSGNANVEEALLAQHLTKAGYTTEHIKRAVYLLKTEADHPTRGLYDSNKAVYSLLRYGVPVKTEAGTATETVRLIDWTHPNKNDFAIAEEVTLKGGWERRPDLVLYLNGIAIGVIELKSSHVSISEGIHQLLSNQQPEFNAAFFATVQFLFAGNNSEGLQYGTVETPEKMFLRWKEDEEENTSYKLDKYLAKICRKERFLELIYDFILFDGGIKKLPRVHQYFGIKESQNHIRRLEGGIIWHTQGSGKSIVMVLLAKWILENRPNARVLILTDRDELDKQIERVFGDAGETISRTNSGKDLMVQLALAAPRLLCSLVHKFGKKGVKDFDAFIAELRNQPSPAVGELFVFVDECHRTQSGKLHKTMKVLLPNAVFIGFTGTPLLKEDRATSMEVFGKYIHTYKFGEAVEDRVVLDLLYEARDIEQELSSPQKVDTWFEAKTKGLNSWQKAALREQWGTMQKVLSSRSRIEKVVQDVLYDFTIKPRLSDGMGNAMLVASSIYEAAKYYEAFQKTALKCALVTSYDPDTKIHEQSKEETGANTETDKQFLFNLYKSILKEVQSAPGKSKSETYEDQAKARFIREPGQMQLLIVVDKLLTGFDAPSCTYLYIDKVMRDHGLFQAICRTNRLDGETKDFGYIIDYKDLFKNVQGAIKVYTSELDDSDGGSSPEILLEDRLKKGSERLENALESLDLLCEPVQPPRTDLEHIHYFCGNVDLPQDLKVREPQRESLYKATAALVRSFANIADDLQEAGYTLSEVHTIKAKLEHYVKLREIIRQASGETIDLKTYEADMRHLIDTYIEAKPSKTISNFGELGLLEIIFRSGIAEAINQLPEGIKSSEQAVAETIANNVRSKIIKEHLNDPAFYDRMSELLAEILEDLKAKRLSYQEFLKKIAELAKQTLLGKSEETPKSLDTAGKRALYSNLMKAKEHGVATIAEDPPKFGKGSDPVLELALRIDRVIKTSRPDDWRGNSAKEQTIKKALLAELGEEESVEKIFPIIKAQQEY